MIITKKCKEYIDSYDGVCINSKMNCGKDICNSWCHHGIIDFDWIDYIKWGHKYAKE